MSNEHEALEWAEKVAASKPPRYTEASRNAARYILSRATPSPSTDTLERREAIARAVEYLRRLGEDGWGDGDIADAARCADAVEALSLPAREVSGEREVLAEGYKALSRKRFHASDCATSRAPAEMPGPCDCDFDGDKKIAAQVIADFNGGLVTVPDSENPRGYVTYYRPLEAMRVALSKAALATTPAPREMEADLVEAKKALKPFAELADTAERFDWLDDAGFTLMHHHKFVGSVWLAQLRAARATLNRLSEEG